MNKKSTITKAILTNLAVLLVCIAYISGFTFLFGKENSTIGVFALTACFIFLKADLNLRKKESCVSIVLMFAIIAIAPKLSLYNSFVGILVNFVSILTILILTTYQHHKDNHVAFMLGYIFCQGYNVSGMDYRSRVYGLIFGAVMVSLIYYLTHKDSDENITFGNLFSGIKLTNERTHWQLKMTLALTIVMFLGQITAFPKTMWISFTVLSLIQADQEVGRSRRLRRIPGALLGILLFLIIFGVLIPEQYHGMATLLCGYLIMFVKEYLPKTAMNTLNALIAANAFLPMREAAWLRIIANVAGVLFLLLFSPMYDAMIKKVNEKRNDRELCG